MRPLGNLFAALLFLLSAAPAFAWNALGHKTVAEIAWQELDATTRQQIADTLRRHPAFDRDFAERMPAEIAIADKATQDHWIFRHAATWPDIARGGPHDRPTWHYINRPAFLDGERQVSANLSTEYPAREPYNCIQATKNSIAALESRAGAETKALAYCWLFHLVGDMHQPMHSTALFSEYFPKGDRGGNDIPLARGRNLHALWDNLLGRQHRMRDVERELAELKVDQDAWTIDAKTGPEEWIAESHELAKRFAYDPIILQAVREAKHGDKLLPILLPESYMQEAGRLARRRIVAAGLRLAALLVANRDQQTVPDADFHSFVTPLTAKLCSYSADPCTILRASR